LPKAIPDSESALILFRIGLFNDSLLFFSRLRVFALII